MSLSEEEEQEEEEEEVEVEVEVEDFVPTNRALLSPAGCFCVCRYTSFDMSWFWDEMWTWKHVTHF